MKGNPYEKRDSVCGGLFGIGTQHCTGRVRRCEEFDSKWSAVTTGKGAAVEFGVGGHFYVFGLFGFGRSQQSHSPGFSTGTQRQGRAAVFPSAHGSRGVGSSGG